MSAIEALRRIPWLAEQVLRSRKTLGDDEARLDAALAELGPELAAGLKALLVPVFISAPSIEAAIMNVPAAEPSRVQVTRYALPPVSPANYILDLPAHLPDDADPVEPPAEPAVQSDRPEAQPEPPEMQPEPPEMQPGEPETETVPPESPTALPAADPEPAPARVSVFEYARGLGAMPGPVGKLINARIIKRPAIDGARMIDQVLADRQILASDLPADSKLRQRVEARQQGEVQKRTALGRAPVAAAEIDPAPRFSLVEAIFELRHRDYEVLELGPDSFKVSGAGCSRSELIDRAQDIVARERRIALRARPAAAVGGGQECRL